MTQPTSGVEHGDQEEHGGHSMAAWTAVVIILVGSLVMALAVVFPSRLWFVVGAVVVVVGAIAGKVMAMAGYGDKASTRGATHHAGGNADLPGRTQSDSGTQ